MERKLRGTFQERKRIRGDGQGREREGKTKTYYMHV
jgi:hypothetical protein